MAVGMPGTGLGGVFYFCMAIAMPVKQAMRWWEGKSDASQWRSVAIHTGLLTAILMVMWVEALVIRFSLQLVLAWTPTDWALHAMVAESFERAAPGLVFVPFALLGLVVGGLHLLKMELDWWERCRDSRRDVMISAGLVA